MEMCRGSGRNERYECLWNVDSVEEKSEKKDLLLLGELWAVGRCGDDDDLELCQQLCGDSASGEDKTASQAPSS